MLRFHVRFRGFMRRALITFLMVFVLSIKSFAQESSVVPEDSLKAAFIFHFITYTEWNDNSKEYNVCIPNNEPLKKAAQQSFKGKTVNNRKINVSDEAHYCHVLVSNDLPNNPEEVLTIGDLNRGALLEFRRINDKLKFAADMEHIKKTRLKISSQLLKLAILEDKNL
jgi:hypothetical protein